jgi:hypothetical protein
MKPALNFAAAFAAGAGAVFLIDALQSAVHKRIAARSPEHADDDARLRATVRAWSVPVEPSGSGEVERPSLP